MESQRVRHDWENLTFTFTVIILIAETLKYLPWVRYSFPMLYIQNLHNLHENIVVMVLFFFSLFHSWRKLRPIEVKLTAQDNTAVQFSSFAQLRLTLRPHGLQHARPPCSSRTPEACSNSCPLSWWCHQPSHPLSSPSPPAFNLSQHQGLFKWVSSLHQMAKVLQSQLQHQSFQWIFRTYSL